MFLPSPFMPGTALLFKEAQIYKIINKIQAFIRQKIHVIQSYSSLSLLLFPHRNNEKYLFVWQKIRQLTTDFLCRRPAVAQPSFGGSSAVARRLHNRRTAAQEIIQSKMLSTPVKNISCGGQKTLSTPVKKHKDRLSFRNHAKKRRVCL